MQHRAAVGHGCPSTQLHGAGAAFPHPPTSAVGAHPTPSSTLSAGVIKLSHAHHGTQLPQPGRWAWKILNETRLHFPAVPLSGDRAIKHAQQGPGLDSIYGVVPHTEQGRNVITQPTTTHTVTEYCAALCGDSRGQLGVEQQSVPWDQAGWNQTFITRHLFPCGIAQENLTARKYLHFSSRCCRLFIVAIFLCFHAQNPQLHLLKT